MPPKTPPKTTPESVPAPDQLTARSIPLDLPDVPLAVREATNAVHAAQERIVALGAEARAARKEWVEAPRADRIASAAAEREQRPAPEPTAPALKVKADTLARQVQGARDAFKEVTRAQDAAVEAVRDEWAAAALAQADATLAEYRDLVAQQDELFDRLAVQGAVVAALDEFATGHQLAIRWPTPGIHAEQREQTRERLAGHFGSVSTTVADYPNLSAALELLALRARGEASPAHKYERAAWSGDPDDADGAHGASVTADMMAKHGQ